MPTQDWNDPQDAKKWDAEGDKRNPIRSEQLDILLSVLADHLIPGQWIVDLGFGSGKVEALIFKNVPQAKVVGVDMSRAMMELAAERLAPYRASYEAIEHNLADIDSLSLPPHPYQFVIASQSLHHLPNERMQPTYRWIHQILEPGGMFLLLERIRVESAATWPVLQSVWRRQDRLHPSNVVQHEGESFAHHEQIVLNRGDHPLLLQEHLQWLQNAGFTACCLHLHGNRALLAGVKNQ